MGALARFSLSQRALVALVTVFVAVFGVISAGQLKAQDAGYTLTPEGDKTRVKFDIAIDLSVPMPGFILKRTMKGGVETATEGLKKQVHKVLQQ